MEKKEFLDVSREYFKSIGFQILKKSKFFYESEELVLQVYMNHSNFSEQYYVDYYIRIKALHPNINEITNDKEWDTHFARLTNGKDTAFIVEYENMDVDSYSNILERLVTNQIVPIMQGGVNFIKHFFKNRKKYELYIVFSKDAEKVLLNMH